MTLATRLAGAMILLVAIAVSAVGWLSYRSLEQAFLPRVLDRIETHSQLVAADLQSQVRGARADIAAFRSAAASNGLIRAHLNGGIDPVDGLSEKTWRDRIAERLLAELEAKPAYAQFRIIGIENGGREMVRADRSGPNRAVRLVPDAELQRKGDRVLTEIYDIDYALRVRIDLLEESEWGKRLDNLMDAIATLVEAEVSRFPKDVGHVLGSRSLRRHQSLAGRLTYLAWKGRDAISGGAAYCMRLVGQPEKFRN